MNHHILLIALFQARNVRITRNNSRWFAIAPRGSISCNFINTHEIWFGEYTWLKPLCVQEFIIFHKWLLLHAFILLSLSWRNWFILLWHIRQICALSPGILTQAGPFLGFIQKSIGLSFNFLIQIKWRLHRSLIHTWNNF